MSNIGQWWSEPIVFEKAVLYTMLFECRPRLRIRPAQQPVLPPMGSIIYWLRPGTIRLPPWPNQVPLTKGDSRGPVDVVLYGALLAMLVVALFSDGTGPIPELGTEVGLLPTCRSSPSWRYWPWPVCATR